MSELLKKISISDIEKLRLLITLGDPKEKKDICSLKKFIEQYKEFAKANRSISYYNSIELSFIHLTNYFSDERSIDSIELQEFEKFVTFLQQKAKRGYEVYFRNLRAAFNKAKDWGYICTNNLARIKLPKRQKTVPQFISSNELYIITERIELELIKDFVKTAFYTGMRLSELENLRWKNVDLNTRIITVGDESFITKSRKQRFVPICDELFELLLKRKANASKHNSSRKQATHILRIDNSLTGNSFVFKKNNGDKYTGDFFSRNFKKACIAAGINKSLHFHSLRHSFASNLAQKGISLYIIKELLGHSSIQTTEIYSHLNLETLKEAINR